jgi:hypothetical protein
MTTYDTSANVETEVEDISIYTIGTSGTITDAQFVRFLAKSDAQVVLDDPGFTQVQANEANALLICHYIARKYGKSGKTSESMGRGSYSKKLNHQTSWLDDYYELIDIVRNPEYGVENLSTDGITRDDAVMDGLNLDQSTSYDLNDETRDTT